MLFKLYVIWHNKLFDSMYENLDQDTLNKLIMYGVNDKYSKKYNKSMNYNILYEYNLPKYIPNWQLHGYCQTSCMYHLFINKMYNENEYIGFLQYDMKPSNNMFSHIDETITNNSGKQIIFTLLCKPASDICKKTKGLCLPYEYSILKHYNNFFKTKFTYPDIAENSRSIMPLLHTFIISGSMFLKMMSWIATLLPWLDMCYVHITDMSQAEFSERIFALFLCLEIISNEDVILETIKINHVWPMIHDQTEWINYKKITL